MGPIDRRWVGDDIKRNHSERIRTSDPGSHRILEVAPILSIGRSLSQSDLEYSPPDRNSQGVRPIVRVQFTHEILNVEIHSRLRYAEASGNFLVLRAISNEAEHIQLAGRQRFIAQMFRQADGDIRRHVAFAGMHGTDDREQLVLRQALQDIGGSAGPQGALNLRIAFGAGQHNDARIGTLSTNGDDSVDAIGSGQA